MREIEFIVAGSPRIVARAIEKYADEQRMVSALVVPWESDGDTLNIAVTSAKADGWAIEHLNLGTIRLTGAGSDRTRVAVLADRPTGAGLPAAESQRDPERPEREKRARLFDAFVRHIQQRLEAAI